MARNPSWRRGFFGLMGLVMLLALAPARLGHSSDAVFDDFSKMSYDELMARSDKILRERDFAGRLALQRLQERETDGKFAIECLETLVVLRYRPGMWCCLKGPLPTTLDAPAIRPTIRALSIKAIREMRTVALSEAWSQFVAQVGKLEILDSVARDVLVLPPLRAYARDLARATALEAPLAMRLFCQEFLDAPIVTPDLVKP